MTRWIQNTPIILASRSPRRNELLKQAGLDFSVIPSPVEENFRPNPDPSAHVLSLAQEKALWVSSRHPESWVIGADTIVFLNGAILEKPESRAAAESMLRSLSGTTHIVFTGYALVRESTGRAFCDTVQTEVTFKLLTEAEIAWYASTPEPYDKAGAYAIQGLGTFLVERIHGSYTCVVGLPVCEIMDFFIREKVIQTARSAA